MSRVSNVGGRRSPSPWPSSPSTRGHCQQHIHAGRVSAKYSMRDDPKRLTVPSRAGAAGTGKCDAGLEPTSVDKYSRACGRRLDLRHFPGASVQREGMVRHAGALLVGACGEPCPGLEPGISCRPGLARFSSEEHTSELQSLWDLLCRL